MSITCFLAKYVLDADLILHKFVVLFIVCRKATLADDKQDIRVIQERFYEDGDLLLGSLGRRRNYKWHNIDNIANANTSSDESELDDEGDAGFNSPSIHQSAVERLEREAFCEEQSVSC